MEPDLSPSREQGGTARLFLAVDLPEGVRRALDQHLRASLPGTRLPGRAVRPESWHLTLRFLGDTPPDLRRRVVDEVRGAELGERFALAFDRLGAFPRPARASVLWLGIAEGGDRLAALAFALEEAARRAGFPAETRPFAAHLTLSRIRPAEDVRPLVERVPPFAERTEVEEVVLFRSHLGAGGARYEAVERFPLRP